MSMDPMSVYSPMMYHPEAGAMSSFGYANIKSSIHSDSTSANAGINFNDYDDESGNYYMRRAAARRRKLAQADFGADLQRADLPTSQQQQQQQQQKVSAMAIGKQTMLLPPDEDEQIDHGDQETASGAGGYRRVKRQVYYQSGYNGERLCHGFPLEINVRSRIKMEQVFPIHGKSQFKKCIKVG